MTEKSENIRKFVCAQLRHEPDLSTLTIRVLKQRYLAHTSSESMSFEAKQFMKEVVKEELVKMQEQANSSWEIETKTSSKRKREHTGDGDECMSDSEEKSRAKKKRHQTESSSESEEKHSKASSDELETEDEIDIKKENKAATKQMQKKKRVVSDEELTEKKKPVKTKRRKNLKTHRNESDSGKQNDQKKSTSNITQKSNVCEDNDDQMEEETAPAKKIHLSGNVTSDNSEDKGNLSDSENVNIQDKEINEDEVAGRNSDGSDDEEAKNEKGIQQNDSEADSDRLYKEDQKNEKATSSDDSEKEESGSVKRAEVSDSNSSSLPSLEDEPLSKSENIPKNKKLEVSKKKREKEKKVKSSDKEEHRSVVRLKRYIALCGVRRNYKKILEGCRSVRSIVQRLTKELEDLGVQGKPTIEKCKKIRKKRETAQEIAELDTSNIITGRPKRRAALPWYEQKKSPIYQRILDSESDSDQQKPHKGQRKTDWENLQGIISDDGESD